MDKICDGQNEGLSYDVISDSVVRYQCCRQVSAGTGGLVLLYFHPCIKVYTVMLLGPGLLSISTSTLLTNWNSEHRHIPQLSINNIPLTHTYTLKLLGVA